MFGDRPLPKMKTRVRPKPLITDIHLPTNKPYCYGHMGRPANTDQHVKLLLYKQKKDADYIRSTEQEKEKFGKDKFEIKFDKHTVKRRFQAEIRKRVDLRMQEYDESIERRRDKLRELFATEEREYYKETVDVAQRSGESRMEAMKKKAQMLIAKREAKREEVVKQKRIQQYMQRCVDLRGALAQKNLVDSKNGQLQQMRENQARREKEKEYDRMWYDLSIKEMHAKREREEYEALDRYQRDKSNMDVWDIQVKAKELLKEEQNRIALEDRMELEKLQEKMHQEEIQAELEKRRKRDLIDKELQEQLKKQEEFLEQRRKEEEALMQAFIMLAQMELDKERAKVVDTTSDNKREMAQYKASIEELKKQREDEERHLNDLLEQYKKEIQKKQDDARCKVEAAKKKLLKDVLEGRAEQIKNKQELAEEQLKMQQADNEFTRLAYEANERLAQETARQEKMAREEYKHDLLKQIEYNKLLQQREREELERQLAVGKQEEERFTKMVEDMCSGKIVAGKKHHFRKVIERHDCYCPETSVDPPY